MVERRAVPDAFGEKKPRTNFFTSLVSGQFAPDALVVGIYNRLPYDPIVQDAFYSQWKDHGGKFKSLRTTLSFAQPPEVVYGKLHLPVTLSNFVEFSGSRSSAIRSLDPETMHQADAIGTSIVVRTGDDKLMIANLHKQKIPSTISGYPDLHDDTGANGFWDPFKTMKRELEEEAGLFDDDITEIFATGVIRNNRSRSNQPVITFMAQSPLTAEEILQRKCEDGIERKFIADTPKAVADFITSYPATPSPTALGTLMHYGKVAYGDIWYNSVHDIVQTAHQIYEDKTLEEKKDLHKEGLIFAKAITQ